MDTANHADAPIRERTEASDYDADALDEEMRAARIRVTRIGMGILCLLLACVISLGIICSYTGFTM